jgi:hypothetical protein
MNPRAILPALAPLTLVAILWASAGRAAESPSAQAYPAIGSYAVINLGLPHGVNPSSIFPVAINNNGVIVANVSGTNAYKGRPTSGGSGTWTSLNTFQVADINDNGDYVGLATLDGTGVTECWTAAGGTVLLQSADPDPGTGPPFASSLTAEIGTGTNTTVTVAGVTPVSTYGIGSDLTPPAVVEDPCTVPCTWAVNTSGTLAPAGTVNGIEYGWAAPFIEKNNGTGAATWNLWGNIIAMSSSGQYIGSAGVGPAPDPGDPGSVTGTSEGQYFFGALSSSESSFIPVDVNNNGVVLGTLNGSMILRAGLTNSSNDVILPDSGSPTRLTSESGTDYLIFGYT